jgi:hypothetical protein
MAVRLLYVYMYIAGEGLKRPQHRDHPWSIVLSPTLTVRLLALHVGCPFAPGRSLVFISVRGCFDHRAIVWLEGLCQLKKSSDLIRNWTHDLLACSIVLQPAMLPCAHTRPYSSLYSISRLSLLTIFYISHLIQLIPWEHWQKNVIWNTCCYFV